MHSGTSIFTQIEKCWGSKVSHRLSCRNASRFTDARKSSSGIKGLCQGKCPLAVRKLQISLLLSACCLVMGGLFHLFWYLVVSNIVIWTSISSIQGQPLADIVPWIKEFAAWKDGHMRNCYFLFWRRVGAAGSIKPSMRPNPLYQVFGFIFVVGRPHELPRLMRFSHSWPLVLWWGNEWKLTVYASSTVLLKQPVTQEVVPSAVFCFCSEEANKSLGTDSTASGYVIWKNVPLTKLNVKLAC